MPWEWVVMSVGDADDDTEVVFVGLIAERRAREYAAWLNQGGG